MQTSETPKEDDRHNRISPLTIDTQIIQYNTIQYSMSKNKDPTLVHRKVAILGFRAVGKSSLTNSFMTGTFSDDYDPTIESTHHKTIRFRKVHFATDIVDTAGMVSRAGGSLTF